MVYQETASKWLKTKVSNTLVCNMPVSAGLEMLLASMVRDQTKNVT